MSGKTSVPLGEDDEERDQKGEERKQNPSFETHRVEARFEGMGGQVDRERAPE